MLASGRSQRQAGVVDKDEVAVDARPVAGAGSLELHRAGAVEVDEVEWQADREALLDVVDEAPLGRTLFRATLGQRLDDLRRLLRAGGPEAQVDVAVGDV